MYRNTNTYPTTVPKETIDNVINLRDNRGSYSGRSSRDSATGGGYSRRPQGEGITEDRASNVLQGAADTDREKLEDKTRTIIEEYLQVWYCHTLLMDF